MYEYNPVLLCIAGLTIYVGYGMHHSLARGDTCCEELKDEIIDGMIAADKETETDLK